MLRARTGPVKAALCGAVAAALAAVALVGCYWQRYPRLIETHLALLLDYATKLQILADDHRPVPPEAWGEFTYPLERARDFSRIVAQRFPGRRSLALFDQAVAQYAELVASPDILTRPDAAADIARRVAELRQLAEATRGALAEEER